APPQGPAFIPMDGGVDSTSAVVSIAALDASRVALTVPVTRSTSIVIFISSSDQRRTAYLPSKLVAIPLVFVTVSQYVNVLLPARSMATSHLILPPEVVGRSDQTTNQSTGQLYVNHD